MRCVKGVIQVVGQARIPLVPKYSDELRNWYHKVHLTLNLNMPLDLYNMQHSLVFVPSNHVDFTPDFKELKRHGKLVRIGL